jgi:hypothetical protein
VKLSETISYFFSTEQSKKVVEKKSEDVFFTMTVTEYKWKREKKAVD